MSQNGTETYNTPLAPALNSAWFSGICVYIAYVLMVATSAFSSLASMAEIWANSAAYAHGPIAIVMALSIILQTSSNRTAAPRPWPAALIAVCGASLILAGGRVFDIQIVEHFAFIALLIAGAALIFGAERARAWAGGFAFAFFCVPFGESAIPFLQAITTSLATIFLALSAVPFTSDGNIITTGVATFHVAPGCAGLGGVLMSLMVSTLFSLAAFSTWRQHALMLSAGITLALVANGLRVFAIIALAQNFGGDWQGLHDHAFMGWLFNGAAIALLVLFGARLSRPRAED